MAMEIVTLAFPIYQILKHKRASRETNRVLAAFDQKQVDSSTDTGTLRSSLTPGSLKSKRNGKMASMETLDECLAGNHDSLQVYASCMELNGENIIFLTKVLAFKQACLKAFHSTCNSSSDFRRARNDMFRQALTIFVTLVHSHTASYPINIESPIYNRLEAIFGPATALVAMCKTPSRTSSFSAASSSATPWDDPQGSAGSRATSPAATPAQEFPSFPMRALSKSGGSKYASGDGNGSSERIVGVGEEEMDGLNNDDQQVRDPLEGVKVPAEFDEGVFDAAFKSVRYMVWSETWQRFMVWKQKAGHESVGRAI
ncbi:MAG: hypothetical protein L6R39_002672 [Caloplaca ligustica]|nr:MAG: hypothetical protein L6R39_002672 [Caloplaca ligustica]